MWPGRSRQSPIGREEIGPEQETRFYWCGASMSDDRTAGRLAMVIGSIDPGPSQTTQMRARASAAEIQKMAVLG